MASTRVSMKVGEWTPDLEKDYIILEVRVGQVLAAEYIEKSSDVETVAKQLEWLAHKLRVKSAPSYNAARIAWELERTAKGDGHYGNALRVAKDIPGLTDEDRALLDRFATGRNGGTDHVALQDLALRIDAIAKATERA